MRTLTDIEVLNLLINQAEKIRSKSREELEDLAVELFFRSENENSFYLPKEDADRLKDLYCWHRGCHPINVPIPSQFLGQSEKPEWNLPIEPELHNAAIYAVRREKPLSATPTALLPAEMGVLRVRR